MNVNFLMFDQFETLDLFGPLEILARVKEYDCHYFSLQGGSITNAQGVSMETRSLSEIDRTGILVIPGGQGTRPLVKADSFIRELEALSRDAAFVLSICTGSALLAKSGILEGCKATSNKRAMDWVKSVAENVIWKDQARWVVDGKYYTSSGVSAGMDMALGFVCDRFGHDRAKEIADQIEYLWNENAEQDLFSIL